MNYFYRNADDLWDTFLDVNTDNAHKGSWWYILDEHDEPWEIGVGFQVRAAVWIPSEGDDSPYYCGVEHEWLLENLPEGFWQKPKVEKKEILNRIYNEFMTEAYN